MRERQDLNISRNKSVTWRNADVYIYIERKDEHF